MVAVVTTLASLVVAASAVPASAHAELIRSDPEADSVRSQAPTQVTLTFGEDLRPIGRALVVTDPSGARVVQPDTLTTDGPVMSVQLTALTVPGLYRVAYRVVSADGHPVSGDYTFTLDVGAAGGVSGASPTSSAPTAGPVASSGTSSSGASALPWLAAALILGLAVGLTAVVRRRRDG